jgi:uncharacterized protein (TIGR02145 family)
MNKHRFNYPQFVMLIATICSLPVSYVLDAQQSTTGPFRPAGVSMGIIKEKSSLQGAGVKTIEGVPSYLWHRGCGPTALGMIIGYYDSQGFPDLIEGEASTQSTDVNNAIASDLHYNDYSLPLDYSPNLLKDKSELGGAHTSNSIGDFMKTSWSSRQNYWGWSWASDVAPAFSGFVSLKNSLYIVTNSYIYFSNPDRWNLFKNEIDNNRPVVLLVDSNGDGSTDHFVTGIGYDDNTSMYAIYDTWDNNIHWYQWRSMSSGYAWGIYGFNIFQIEKPAGTVTDIDGNVYGTVVIGTQTWMTNNLKTTKYNDGTVIPFASEIPNTGSYSYYDKDLTNKDIYGALYNWYSVATGKLCPTGWHVPAVTDWNKLTDFLGGESVAGGKMKESGYNHWLAPNTGATNESGFKALPGGMGITTFYYKETNAYFWSSNEYETNNSFSYYSQLYYDNSFGGISGATMKEHGFSVRCIEDNSPSNSLVAYYPFNADTEDHSGYENHGTNNGTVFTTDRFGNPNSAVTFNGLNNYIDCGNNISINPSNAISISCWINTDALNNSRIISKWGLNSGYELDIADNFLRFGLNQNVVGTCDLSQHEGKWTFITGTWDGNFVLLYVNGILKSTSTQAPPLISSPNNLLIGEMANFADAYFNGKIDDIRLYNNALSESEISALYHEGGWPYADLPILTTTSVSSLTQTSVISGGNISSDGGSTIIARGVCWSTSPDPKINLVTKTVDGTGSGSFTSTITGLVSGTTYYLRAYSTNNIGTSYGDNVICKTYNSDAIQDIDGNYYNIVTIGSQVWITENLKTTRYYDGTAIPLVTDNMAWSTTTTPAYCWFENNPTSNKDLYGGLYNWYSVNTGKLCPAGWHVPVDVEWAILFNNLGGATVAGGKLKSTGTLEGGDGLWYSPNTGATNESGFTALPAGGRVADEGYQGIFLTLGFSSYFWSNSETSPDSPIYYYLWNQSESANKSTFLRQTGFSIRCLKDNIPSGTHFVPVWWPGYGTDHMNFYALTAKLDGLDLQPGDEIGIFDGDMCVGMGTLIQVLNGTVYLSMVASKDDPDTPAKDGYTQGNSVTYKVWDLSALKEVVVGNAQVTYVSGAGIFSPGTTAVFNLNAITSITQDIVLTAGWNIMSFAGEPDNMSLSSIVNSLKIAGTLVKIQDEKGNAIEPLPAPVGWVDYIGLMKVSEGYKIKVSANTTLSVTGKPVTLPYTIDLSNGWNIMGYPSMSSQTAMAAFQSLINAGTLLKVQDEKGNAIEQLPAPIGWVDNIHTLAAGEGYKIKVSANTTITINNSGKGEYQNAEFVTVIKPSHFKPAYTGNGFDHMNIYLKEATIGGAGIKAGDEIGVFDGGLCVGAVVVEDPNSEYIMMTASLDDPTTTETDGFITGHNFTLKLWDRQSGIERNTQNVQFEKGSGKLFERLGTSVLSVDFETRAYTSLGDAYPNPSSDKTTFTFRLGMESKVRFEIYNMKGDMIKVLVDDNMSGGTHQIEWDNRSANGTNVSSGIYFYRLKLNNFSQTKQLVIR